jgi:hypothetical protein
MPTERTLIQGRCPTCGPITLLPRHFICALPSDPSAKALAEFQCRRCERWVFNPLTISEARLLLLLGGKKASGSVPLELTEERHGPPVSADELCDFHDAMEAMRFPQVELSGGAS